MNSIAAREDFNVAARIFNNAFNPPFDVNGNPNPQFNPKFDAVTAFRLSQSTLRLEQPCVTTSTLYNFPVLTNIQNQAQAFNTEIRLNIQDSFVPTHVGVFLGFPTSTTDSAFIPYPYPNPFITANYVQYRQFYSSTLSLMINNNQYTQKWDLWRHYKANQTQQTSAAGAGSPIDQQDLSDDGFYPMQPFILLIGSQNIQLNLNLVNAPTAVDANSRIMILLRGILAQNSTVVN